MQAKLRDFVVFSINGREHRVRGGEVLTTLANWLRYDARATGTKIVCEEGDCGACTVLVRRSREEEFEPVNSCILSLAQMDGASIVTVEGLRMNAVQQSMVVHHGAQCGYCTPGFIMTVKALLDHNDDPTEEEIKHALSGNLCRCTGYQQMYSAIRAAIRAEQQHAKAVVG